MSKEVCVYSYKQKTVVAPAQMTEVTWERRQKRFAVNKCTKEIIKEGYDEREVELCGQKYVEIPYTLPASVVSVDDFLELNIPEPEQSCQTYKYKVPEVICKVSVKTGKS